jgi:hypothetical protein
MTYKRKTEDEYQVHGYYPTSGWEEVTCETTRSEARARLREYRDNEPGRAFKIVKRRIKLSDAG